MNTTAEILSDRAVCIIWKGHRGWCSCGGRVANGSLHGIGGFGFETADNALSHEFGGMLRRGRAVQRTSPLSALFFEGIGSITRLFRMDWLGLSRSGSHRGKFGGLLQV